MRKLIPPKSYSLPFKIAGSALTKNIFLICEILYLRVLRLSYKLEERKQSINSTFLSINSIISRQYWIIPKYFYLYGFEKYNINLDNLIYFKCLG